MSESAQIQCATPSQQQKKSNACVKKCQKVLVQGVQPTHQAVLVFSAEDQQRVRDVFGKCNVLTIEECKGLEFHDVLLVDPFEVLARSVPQGRKLWHSAATAASLDSDSGVLCAWLKSLYVAVTRARRRVWIWCEVPPHQGLLPLWESQGLVVVARSVSELPRGELFAVTSTADELMKQGMERVAQELWVQAVHCFTRVQVLGHAVAERMASFADARAKWDRASQMVASDRRRHLLQDAATTFLSLESDPPDALRRYPLPLYAARCHIEAGDFQTGAQILERCGRLAEAADCYEEGGLWREAGGCCRRFDLWRAMKIYAWHGGWDLCADCCGEAARTSTPSCRGPQDFLRWLCTARCKERGVLPRDLKVDARDLNNVLQELVSHVKNELLLQELVRVLPCPVVALEQLRQADAPKATSVWFQKTLAVMQGFGDQQDFSVMESLRTLTDGLVGGNHCASEVSQSAVRDGLLLRRFAEAFTRFARRSGNMTVEAAFQKTMQHFKPVALWFSRLSPLESLLTSTRAEDWDDLCRAVAADSHQAWSRRRHFLGCILFFARSLSVSQVLDMWYRCSTLFQHLHHVSRHVIQSTCVG